MDAAALFSSAVVAKSSIDEVIGRFMNGHARTDPRTVYALKQVSEALGIAIDRAQMEADALVPVVGDAPFPHLWPQWEDQTVHPPMRFRRLSPLTTTLVEGKGKGKGKGKRDGPYGSGSATRLPSTWISNTFDRT